MKTTITTWEPWIFNRIAANSSLVVWTWPRSPFHLNESPRRIFYTKKCLDCGNEFRKIGYVCETLRQRFLSCREQSIIVPAPVPVPFLWTLDFGFDLDLGSGFWTCIWVWTWAWQLICISYDNRVSNIVIIFSECRHLWDFISHAFLTK